MNESTGVPTRWQASPTPTETPTPLSPPPPPSHTRDWWSYSTNRYAETPALPPLPHTPGIGGAIQLTGLRIVKILNMC